MSVGAVILQVEPLEDTADVANTHLPAMQVGYLQVQGARAELWRVIPPKEPGFIKRDFTKRNMFTHTFGMEIT